MMATVQRTISHPTLGARACPSSLRGRDDEVLCINRCLRGAEAGLGSVLLVEGRRGFGKTRLLDEAGTSARAAGFRVGLGAAFPGDEAVPMTSLLAALVEGSDPVLDGVRARNLRALTHRTSSVVHRLEELLEQAARETPVLVCLDDAHWADRGTVAALRMLPGHLADLPIVWAIAFGSSAGSPGLMDLAAHLRMRGAEALQLRALDDAASEQLVADVVKAEPTTGLMQFVGRSGGNPSLLVELLRGLVDEGLVHVHGGRAELVEARVPQRVYDMTRERLARMSPLARRAVGVASILGTVISFAHMAAMLDVSAASFLEPVEELVLAGMLVEVGPRLAFPNDLIREAVTETVPASARQALWRQAIDVLLEAGASPAEPAASLATSAEAGDRPAISTLIAASRALGPTDPEVAADLSRRAFDLTAAADDLRAPLVAEMVLLLDAAGRGDEGKAVADATLRDRLVPEHEAEVRLSIARMCELSPGVRVDAGQAALALPDLPIALRARHLSELLLNTLASGRPESARALLPETETAVASSGDRSAALALDMAKSQLRYMEGAFHEALHHIDASVVRAGTDVRTRRRDTDLLRAELLITVDQFDAAHQVATDGLQAARRDRQAPTATSWQRFLGRYLLQTGRIAEAAATFDRMLSVGDVDAVVTVGDAATLVARGRIAIHMGDHGRARALAKVAENAVEDAVPELRRHAAWLLALVAMAEGDAARARARLADLGAVVSVLPLLMVDVADRPQLVRIALASGDHAFACAAAEAAEELCRLTPGVSSIAAAAAHARGLLAHDPAALFAAAEFFSAGPRCVPRASALEDHGIELLRHGHRAHGVEAFGEALQIYSSAGAAWDASRVRRRLRTLGVRRRLVKPTRPTTGWAGLTDAEVAVVRLVAEGLTNREVAERLFISRHTASMHLRHVFAKLRISSRVELTRLAFQEDQVA